MLIVAFAFVLITLLAMAGLAIDAGNLYRARLAMQAAADAAALATVNHVSAKGMLALMESNGIPADAADTAKSTAMTSVLKPLAREMIRANLAQARYPDPKTGSYAVVFDKLEYRHGDAAKDPTSTIYEYEVAFRKRVSYFLMDAIPYVGEQNKVITVSSTARRSKAYVAAMLDVSDSMNCPVNSPDCSCLGPGGTGVCTPPTKMDVLADSTKAFLKLFDIEKDHILVVPFNVAAANPNTAADYKASNPLFKDEPVTAALIDNMANMLLGSFQPNSGTNFCDALMRAHAAMTQTPQLAAAEKAYVLFTDGAPTAGRFLFSDVDKLPPNNTGIGGTYDYLNYEVAWIDSVNAVYLGPSLLLQSQEIPIGYSAPIATEGLVDCGDGLKQPPPVGAGAGTADQAAVKVFGTCLKSLQAHLPGQPGRKYGLPYAVPAQYGHWREQYYNCALMMADLIRESKGTFYVIGLGPRAGAPSQTDPYDGVANVLYRKDAFLARLALDFKAADMVKMPVTGQPLEFNFTGYKKYGDYDKNDSKFRPGDYLPTSNPSELKVLFEKAARKVLLRLTS